MQPLVKAEFVRDPKKVAEFLSLAGNPKYGNLTTEQIQKIIQDEFDREAYINDVYQVAVRKLPPPQPGWPEMVHLSIKRLDREPIHDWRELQEIKNQIVGPECEGLEIYPAESRKVDTSNQYHIFAFTDPKVRLPMGFQERCVDDTSIGGSKQRKF